MSKVLDNGEKLHLFAELACYRPTIDKFVLIDASHPDNKNRADKWFKNELSFLCKRDAEELKRIWSKSAEDGRDTRLLFTAVKVLQDKYK